jgi:FtsZ-interacting cell division protein ZipA
MESLRWILLAAGAVFVLVLYVLGRSRRQRKHSIIDELEDDLPEFSATNLDDVDEGVGEVRIISGGGLDVDENLSVNASVDDSAIESPISKMPTDFIVLYILPKNDPNAKQFLAGAEINSSAQAMGLSFGDMNIFHYKPKGQTVFSMANMLEPGSFDAETIHDLKTSGLTVFMKIKGNDPLDDLTEMLQRSYQLAGLLDARLCSHKRETLTEQDAENYRTQVSDFVNGDAPELSTET